MRVTSETRTVATFQPRPVSTADPMLMEAAAVSSPSGMDGAVWPAATATEFASSALMERRRSSFAGPTRPAYDPVPDGRPAGDGFRPLVLRAGPPLRDQ